MKTNYKSKIASRKIRVLSVFLALIALAFNAFSQNIYTFTPCGATGSVGPTQAQVNSSYSLTNLNGMVGTTTTGIQTWTVPYTGNLRIAARGAQGGTCSSAATGTG